MSGAPTTLAALAAELRQELTTGILPWWLRHAVDERHGGFVGLVDEHDVAHPEAPKGAIATARLLWTFSAAHRALGDPTHRAAAERALAFLRAHLLDAEHGGVYWMVEADGRVRDARKHVYAQAFAVYALAEHHRATGDARSLEEALALFALVERHAHDPVHGGYQEAFSHTWALLDDVRLSAVDADERKSMNTHLHVLEAYTALLRVWPDARLRARLAALVALFVERIVDVERGHVIAFFDEDWTPRSDLVSYGHDIETSWLLLEACDVLGDAPLRARVRPVSLAIAEAVRVEALDAAGGIFYERRPGHPVETDKEWWPQAEAIVGFANAWQETGDETYLRAAADTWAFVRGHVVDGARGEWRRRVARDGTPRPGHEKAGPWKCSYHNGRACLELMARAETVPAHVAATSRERPA
jgi:mannobiose 2-epimerase